MAKLSGRFIGKDNEFLGFKNKLKLITSTVSLKLNRTEIEGKPVRDHAMLAERKNRW